MYKTAQDSPWEDFVRTNFRHFSVPDMAHILGVSAQEILEAFPMLRYNKPKTHTQTIVILKPLDD